MDPSFFKFCFFSDSRLPPPPIKLGLSSEMKNTSLVSSAIQRLFLTKIQQKNRALPNIESPTNKHRILEADRKIKNQAKFDEPFSMARTLESPIGQNNIKIAHLEKEKNQKNSEKFFSSSDNKIFEEKFLQLQKRSSDNSKEYDNDGKKQWKESIKSDLERNLKINQFIHDEKNGEAGKSNAKFQTKQMKLDKLDLNIFNVNESKKDDSFSMIRKERSQPKRVPIKDFRNEEDRFEFEQQIRHSLDKKKTVSKPLSSERQNMIEIAKWIDKNVSLIPAQDRSSLKVHYNRLIEIFSYAMSEIIDSISKECMERGLLVDHIWQSQLSISSLFISKMEKNQEKNDVGFKKEREMFLQTNHEELERLIRENKSYHTQMEDRDYEIKRYSAELNRQKTKNERIRQFNELMLKGLLSIKNQLDVSLQDNIKMRLSREDIQFQKGEVLALKQQYEEIRLNGIKDKEELVGLFEKIGSTENTENSNHALTDFNLKLMQILKINSFSTEYDNALTHQTESKEEEVLFLKDAAIDTRGLMGISKSTKCDDLRKYYLKDNWAQTHYFESIHENFDDEEGEQILGMLKKGEETIHLQEEIDGVNLLKKEEWGAQKRGSVFYQSSQIVKNENYNNFDVFSIKNSLIDFQKEMERYYKKVEEFLGFYKATNEMNVECIDLENMTERSRFYSEQFFKHTVNRDTLRTKEILQHKIDSFETKIILEEKERTNEALNLNFINIRAKFKEFFKSALKIEEESTNTKVETEVNIGETNLQLMPTVSSQNINPPPSEIVEVDSNVSIEMTLEKKDNHLDLQELEKKQSTNFIEEKKTNDKDPPQPEKELFLQLTSPNQSSETTEKRVFFPYENEKSISPELKSISPELKSISPELKSSSPELKSSSPELKRGSILMKKLSDDFSTYPNGKNGVPPPNPSTTANKLNIVRKRASILLNPTKKSNLPSPNKKNVRRTTTLQFTKEEPQDFEDFLKNMEGSSSPSLNTKDKINSSLLLNNAGAKIQRKESKTFISDMNDNMVNLINEANSLLPQSKRLAKINSVNFEKCVVFMLRLEASNLPALKTITASTIIKIISQIYCDLIKLMSKKDTPTVLSPLFFIVYDYFCLKYMYTKDRTEDFIFKFIQNVVSYLDIPRVNFFAKLMGIDKFQPVTSFKSLPSGHVYNGLDLNLYFDCFSKLDDNPMKESPGYLLALNSHEHLYTSVKRAVDVFTKFCNNTLNYGFLSKAKIEEFINEIKESKVEDPLISRRYVVEVDLVIEKIFEVQNIIYNNFYLPFYAVDIDGNGVLNLEEFLLLMRNIERKNHKITEFELCKIFNSEHDYIDDEKKEVVLSFRRFAWICLNRNLCSPIKQEEFMRKISHLDDIKNFQELREEFDIKKNLMKLKLIKTLKYNDFYFRTIQKIENTLKIAKINEKEENMVWMQYRIMDEESNYFLLTFEAESCLPWEFNIFGETIHTLDIISSRRKDSNNSMN